MNIQDVLTQFPHLASPAALARADMGMKFLLPPHLELINRELMKAWATPDSRTAINLPFGHGKSVIASQYFPAWVMLLWPDTRIIMIGATEALATSFGGKVKDVVARFGPDLGINLREDSQAKGRWNVEGKEGGMLCKGVGGSVLGYHCELFLIDDVIKDAKSAMSGPCLEDHWIWYKAIVDGRLMPGARVFAIGTRWVRKDLFGRIKEEEENCPSELREGWKFIKLKGIAEKDDPLGRKPGEALWPRRRSAARLLHMKETAYRWFRAAIQQEPEEEKGLWFQPYDAEGNLAWPVYKDVGDAFAVDRRGERRKIWHKNECIPIITMDWAWGKKKTSDFTSPGAYVVTPDAELLILEVKNERWRPEELAPELEKFCIAHPSFVVAVEEGHPTLATDYKKYAGIPEIRWLKTRGANKLARALQGITMSQNGKVFVPHNYASLPWVKPFLQQLAAFTGDESSGEHDDQVDQMVYAAILSQQLRGRIMGRSEGPVRLLPGKEQWGT